MNEHRKKLSTSNHIKDTFEIPTLYQKLNQISATEQIEILDFQKELILNITNIVNKEPKEILYFIIALGYNNTLNMLEEEIPKVTDKLEKLKSYG